MAKILIVDDDEGIRELLRTILEMWGHEVTGVAADLSSALNEARLAQEKGVQIAVIDGNLRSGAPGTGDGEAVSALLREFAPGVRIIAHTGQANGGYGDVFVQKPAPPSDMESAIEKALAMSSKT